MKVCHLPAYDCSEKQIEQLRVKMRKAGTKKGLTDSEFLDMVLTDVRVVEDNCTKTNIYTSMEYEEEMLKRRALRESVARLGRLFSKAVADVAVSAP